MFEQRATVNTITSQVYQDELIPRMPEQERIFTPPRYREMRNIARTLGFHIRSEAMIFRKQGKFMEDHEDDYEYEGVFSRYFPTYQAMNDAQLRGYFTWRTRLRRGDLRPTSLSFAFVYIYELLNLIGVASPEEGFYALQNFGAAYRAFDPKIDRYLKLWLRDFVIYHDLDKTLLGDAADSETDRAVLLLRAPEAHAPDEVFAALNTLSTYDLRSSRFYKQHPEAVERVTCAVFQALSAFFAKHTKTGVCERYFGRIHSSSYRMFRSAVFLERQRVGERVYELSPVQRYLYRNGSWRYERFLRHKGPNRQTGALLKIIDVSMRRKYGFSSTLKEENVPRLHQEIVDREIDRLLEEQRKNARPVIEIDAARFHDIRRSALEIQEKLIVPESGLEPVAEPNAETYATLNAEPGAEPGPEPDAEPGTVPDATPGGAANATDVLPGVNPPQPTDSRSEPVAVPAGAPMPKTAVAAPPDRCGLNEVELQFLRCLLAGGDGGGMLRAAGVMLSVAVDAINAALFDRFGDTVIEFVDDRPVLIEDYLEELRGIFIL